MVKYKFSNRNKIPGLQMACPECNEMITQTDIESYMKCPYCNWKFDHSIELEDFILAPVVDRWVSQHCDIKHEMPHGFGFRVGR